MDLRFLSRCLCAAMIGGILSACGTGQPADVPAEDAEVYESETDDARFLTEKYGFSEGELDGYDASAFVDDYNLRNEDYTAEEVRQLFEENRTYYQITETDKVYQILAPINEIPEKGKDLTPDSDVVKIGFYENPGSLQKYMLFDLENSKYYVDDAVPHVLSMENTAALRNICSDTPICSWKHLSIENSGNSTGSYAWKLVFLLRDGTKCIYGGWTDKDIFPAGFEQVSGIIYASVSE